MLLALFVPYVNVLVPQTPLVLVLVLVQLTVQANLTCRYLVEMRRRPICNEVLDQHASLLWSSMWNFPVRIEQSANLLGDAADLEWRCRHD